MRRRARSIVFCAGSLLRSLPEIEENDYVIAVDGGYVHAKKIGIKPDLLIGDFDSINEIPDESFADRVIRLPAQKDETDLLAALIYGLNEGLHNFHIYGAAGDRPDHVMAAIQCLAFLAERGARGYIYGGKTITTAIQSGIRFAPKESGIISVFAHGGDAKGVSLTGFKYRLENALLKCDFPLGISNEFTGKTSRIDLRSGTLIVIYPCDICEAEIEDD